MGRQRGATYIYDGEGKRVKKLAGTVTTVFVYNISGQLLAEYSDPTPAPPGGTSYITADNLGSPRAIMTSDGAISRRDFQPFGESIPTNVGRSGIPGYPATDNLRQQFTAKERDIETGLDYFLARYYSSIQGRFTSPDPVLESARRAEPQSWNRYTYVLNNPFRYIDPTGENYWDLTARQRQLIDDWAQRQNQANKTNVSAEAMYDALDESQRATFEADANALENTTIIGKDGTKMNGLMP